MPLPHPSQNIPELLANLRTSPIDTENILADPILATINDYFVSKTARQSHHWYCDKADDTLIEAATFLIRLFAYEDSRVHQWKTDLNTCLSSCYKCNFGFERAKEKSCKTCVTCLHRLSHTSDHTDQIPSHISCRCSKRVFLSYQ